MYGLLFTSLTPKPLKKPLLESKLKTITFKSENSPENTPLSLKTKNYTSDSPILKILTLTPVGKELSKKSISPMDPPEKEDTEELLLLFKTTGNPYPNGTPSPLPLLEPLNFPTKTSETKNTTP